MKISFQGGEALTATITSSGAGQKSRTTETTPRGNGGGWWVFLLFLAIVAGVAIYAGNRKPAEETALGQRLEDLISNLQSAGIAADYLAIGELAARCRAAKARGEDCDPEVARTFWTFVQNPRIPAWAKCDIVTAILKSGCCLNHSLGDGLDMDFTRLKELQAEFCD
jgi:hypothetical protein